MSHPCQTILEHRTHPFYGQLSDLKEAVAGCQQLQLFTAAHAAVGDLNPMGFLSVYDRFTKCFFVLQGTKEKYELLLPMCVLYFGNSKAGRLASLHLIISQLSETSSSQKRAGRYLEARYELGYLLESIVVRLMIPACIIDL